MKSFREYLTERRNPIPVGRFDNDEKMNTDHFVMKIERRRIRPEVAKLDIRLGVDAGVIQATQHEIDNRDGFDDPVLEDYEDKPVLIKYDKDKLYILDGHHRMAKAYERNKTISVYIFDLE